MNQIFQKILQAFGLIKQEADLQPDVSPIPTPAPTVVHASQIPNMAQGIFKAEGGGKQAGYSLNNPGDIKYTSYSQSLGAINQVNGFAVFRTMEIGEQACITLITDAALNNLEAYHNCTINQFCQTYAEPPVLSNYVNIVLSFITKVGVTGETLLSELL